MTFVGIAAGTAAAGALYQGYQSIKQNSEANDIDKSNQRPAYTIPSEFYENLNIANQLAQQGIPQQQYNNEVNAINQNQAAGISALNNSANPGSGITSVVRAGNQAISNLNGTDAAQRMDNLRYAMQVRGQLAQQKLAQQQYNLFDKYTEQFNKSAALRGASNQNLEGAVSSVSGLATGLAGQDNNNNGNDRTRGALISPGQTPTSWDTNNFSSNLNFTPQPIQ